MKLAKKNKSKEEEKLDFTVDEEDPLKYFYEMYKNHVYD